MGLKLVPSECIVGLEGCRANVVSALARNLPACARAPRRKSPLAIVGSAPSVAGYLDELRMWPGEIWAINGAYNYLLSQYIVPDGFVGLDPVPGLADYVRDHRPETTFYISSVCDPAVFDTLSGAHVWLWHSKMVGIEYPANSYIVSGGTTCLTRAPLLANLLGWRDITIYGADSSFAEGPYCYPHGTYAEDTQAKTMVVRCNGEIFRTELALVKQVSQLGALSAFLPGLKFRCGGLLAAFLNSPERPLSDFGDYSPEAA